MLKAHTKLETSIFTQEFVLTNCTSCYCPKTQPTDTEMVGSVRWSDNWDFSSILSSEPAEKQDRRVSGWRAKIFHVLLIKPRSIDIDYICKQTDFLTPNPRMRLSPVQSQIKLHHLKPILTAWKSWGECWLPAGSSPLRKGERKELGYMCSISPSKLTKQIKSFILPGETQMSEASSI